MAVVRIGRLVWLAFDGGEEYAVCDRLCRESQVLTSHMLLLRSGPRFYSASKDFF